MKNFTRFTTIALTAVMVVTATLFPAWSEDGKYALAVRDIGGPASISALKYNSLRPDVSSCASVTNKRERQQYAGVTCGSNEWCCRHDFSTGECTKCCSK